MAAGAARLKPKLPKTREGLAAALEIMRIEIRWNVRASREEYRRDGGPWEQLTNNAENKLRCDIEAAISGSRSEKKERLMFGRDRWWQCLSALMEDHQVDPFLVWIEALPEWDGVERMEHWAFWVYDLDQRLDYYNLFAMWASRFCILGPIQRAFQPGCELQEMPVFLSREQGVGKSMALKWLFRKEDQSMFYEDGVEWDADPKLQAEKVAGAVLSEIGEMKGIRRANLDRVKRYVSATHDTVRFSYDKRAETRPRRFAMVGTGNGNKLPPDPTGNRRFVAIPIAGRGKKPEPFMEANRDMLWAEGLAAYQKGQRANLPDEWREIQAGTNEAHRIRDDLVEDVIQDLDEAGAIEGKTMAEIHAGASGRLDKFTGQRIAKALRTEGYDNPAVRVGKSRRRLWKKV